MSSKMTVCKTCGAEVAKSAKTCPKCGAKLKRNYGCLIAILAALAAPIIILYLFIGAWKLKSFQDGIETKKAIAAAPVKTIISLYSDIANIEYLSWNASDKYTDAQIEKMLADLETNMIIEGKVYYVSDFLTVEQSVGNTGDAPLSIICRFSDSEQQNKLVNYNKGETIRVFGKLKIIDSDIGDDVPEDNTTSREKFEKLMDYAFWDGDIDENDAYILSPFFSVELNSCTIVE